MRLPRRALPTLLLLFTLTAAAQTYTPKAIRIDAPPTVDTTEALRIAALPANAPLTKQQIEAALQRLGDTGLFSDIAYTVNGTALVIKLTPAPANQLQPVHFSNFVWWQPAELETILEARVPAYHGQLPLTGSLTDKVKAALIDLLHAKGVDAMVDAHQAGVRADNITLSISNPSILIGDVHLQNTLPALQPQLTKVQQRLQGQDFDLDETSKSLRTSVNDVYRNAGYLAVDTSVPSVSAPHKDMLNFAVDLSATITPGDLYHVSSLTLHAQPPLSDADLQQAANIHPGDTASPAAQRLARSEIQKAYADQGFFGATVTLDAHQDDHAHTVSYVGEIVPGDVYHYNSIDTSALPYDQQAAFARVFTVPPGAVANAHLAAAVQQAILSLHLAYPVRSTFVPDPATHTVKILIKTAASSSTAR